MPFGKEWIFFLFALYDIQNLDLWSQDLNETLLIPIDS